MIIKEIKINKKKATKVSIYVNKMNKMEERKEMFQTTRNKRDNSPLLPTCSCTRGKIHAKPIVVNVYILAQIRGGGWWTAVEK